MNTNFEPSNSPTTLTTPTHIEYDDIIYAQRIRGFSHHNAAKMFLQGKQCMRTNPRQAERFFTSVIKMEPDNPYGYIYLLFVQEDLGYSVERLLLTCDDLMRVASKKNIHGLIGIADALMLGYLRTVEKMRQGL
jgi:hypothetical protein